MLKGYRTSCDMKSLDDGICVRCLVLVSLLPTVDGLSSSLGFSLSFPFPKHFKSPVIVCPLLALRQVDAFL